MEVFELGFQKGIMKIEPFITFNLFNTNMKYDFAP
jgi:hypothetical protein